MASHPVLVVIGHVPERVETTGPSASQLSASIDQ